VTPLRDMPNNVEAERSMLGSVLIRPSIWPQVTAELPSAEALFLPAHQEIYDAMGALAARSLPFDPVTVGEEIKSRGALAKLDGGIEYLYRLAEETPTAENVAAYVSLVRTAANKRRLIRICSEVSSRAAGDVDLDLLMQDAAQALSAIVLRSATKLTLLGDDMTALLEDIDQRKSKGPRGVSTGIGALDDMTWGFLPEELVIFGADPAAGKSALAVQTGLRFCIQDGGTCFCANLEMSKQQLAERALAHLASVNSYYLRRGIVSPDEWHDLYRAGGLLAKIEFYVEDRVRTVAEFEARARVWRARHPDRKGLAIFDFLQLARTEDGPRTNRAQQVAADARRLKDLAGELKVPIIAVSSLNREGKAAEKPPTMTSLKESGDVEYAADFVILIWNKDSTKDGPVTLVVAKTRNGPGGPHDFVTAHWTGRHYRFSDVEQGSMPPEQQQLSVA
jgi:replicative DNA helicase